MADNNNATPTQDIINNCKLELCREKVAAEYIHEAECIEHEISEEGLLCSLYVYKTTNSILDLYCGVDFNYAVPLIKGKELIKGQLDELIEKNNALGSKYKDLVKMIREVRQNYTDVLDEACKLQRCIEEEELCNPDTSKELGKVDGLVDNIIGLEDEARNCYDKICETFNASIDIAGIQTFTNIESLLPYCANLTALLEELRKDIDGNITDMNVQLIEDKKAAMEALEARETQFFEKCQAEIAQKTVCDIFDYVCDPACGTIAEGKVTIKEICEKLKKDFSEENDPYAELQAEIEGGDRAAIDTSGSKTEPSKDGGTQNRKSKNEKQGNKNDDK